MAENRHACFHALLPLLQESSDDNHTAIGDSHQRIDRSIHNGGGFTGNLAAVPNLGVNLQGDVAVRPNQGFSVNVMPVRIVLKDWRATPPMGISSPRKISVTVSKRFSIPIGRSSERGAWRGDKPHLAG